MRNEITSPQPYALKIQADTSLKIGVLVFLMGMVLLWTVLCSVSHSAPDLDGMEELVWASSLELGYYKHPPLPSWVLYGLTSLFGKPIWLTFFAGQVFSAIALWFVWLLGCEFTSPKKALMAMLMVSTTIYFSLRGTIYNHNTVQLWSIVASTWLFYRALRYQKLSSWIWLGIVAALAMMTKYSAVIQFAVFFFFLLWQGHFRQASVRKGLFFALVFFLVIFSPHVYWLFIHSFEPLHYADKSIEASSYIVVLQDAYDFLVDQLARLSPMLVLWLVLWRWNKKSNKVELNANPTTQTTLNNTETYASELSQWDRAFLLCIGFGPIVLTTLVSIVLGTRLVASWATTFFILYGFFAFWWLSGDEQKNLRKVAILVIIIHVLLAVGYALGRGPLAYYAGRSTRSTFPGSAISAQMHDIWRNHVENVPLGLVASDTWLGGNIAVHISPKTNVFIDANYKESPWLNPKTALDCGVLVAYSLTTRGEPAASLVKLYQQSVWQGVTQLAWSSPKSQTIVVNWGIIPPTAACSTAVKPKSVG